MIVVPQGRAKEVAVELARQAIGSTGFNLPQPICVMRGGNLAAIAVFHDYRPPDMQVSLYAVTPRWAHKSTVRDLLGYAFIQHNCARVTAMAKRKNKRSRKLIEGLGWKLEGVLRKAAQDGGDLMLYGMIRSEYEARYGSVRSTYTTAVPERPGAAPARGQAGPAAAPAAAGHGRADRPKDRPNGQARQCSATSASIGNGAAQHRAA